MVQRRCRPCRHYYLRARQPLPAPPSSTLRIHQGAAAHTSPPVLRCGGLATHLVCVLVGAVQVLQVVDQHLDGVDLLAKLLVDLKGLLVQVELDCLYGKRGDTSGKTEKAAGEAVQANNMGQLRTLA